MAHVESLDHYWWVEVFVVCFALKNSVAYIAITIVVMDFFQFDHVSCVTN